MWRGVLILVGGLLLMQVACDSTHKGGLAVDELPENFDPEQEANFESILNRLFLKPNCKCHVGKDPDHGIALDSYNGVLDVSSGIVRPYKPLESKLYTALRDGSMPKGNRPRVSKNVLRMVYLWIEKGALKTNPKKPRVPTPHNPDAPQLAGEPCDVEKVGDEPLYIPCEENSLVEDAKIHTQ